MYGISCWYFSLVPYLLVSSFKYNWVFWVTNNIMNILSGNKIFNFKEFSFIFVMFFWKSWKFSMTSTLIFFCLMPSLVVLSNFLSSCSMELCICNTSKYLNYGRFIDFVIRWQILDWQVRKSFKMQFSNQITVQPN